MGTVNWANIESGCRLLAVMNEGGEAFSIIRDGVIEELAVSLGQARATEAVDSLVAKFRSEP